MSDIVFVLVETSPAGDSVLGVFTSIADARAFIPQGDGVRLEDYRVECHVVDQPVDLYSPWQVSITRAGGILDVSPIIACAYCDEVETVLQASFVEEGGDLMRLAVWARSKGRAHQAALHQHAYLVENGLWPNHATPVEPLHTEDPSEALAAGHANQPR